MRAICFSQASLGKRSDASEDDAAGLEEEQDVVGGQAGGGPDFSGEEVGGPEDGRVPADERGPGGVAFAFGCRAQPGQRSEERAGHGDWQVVQCG